MSSQTSAEAEGPPAGQLTAPCAAGILEGMAHFGFVWPQTPADEIHKEAA